MAEWNPRVNDVFLKVFDRTDPAARRALLAEHCGADAELFRAVETLLNAHDRAGGFLSDPNSAAAETGTHDAGPARVDPTSATTDVPGRDEHVGAVIVGKYKLIEEIGEGGMGCVYMAQQTEPVKRAVAIKVIKAGMDSKAVLARFDAERQALAMMDHPNIAKVLDAGATASGRPFFVMELVKGVPITQFCDARKLTPRQRLELFVPVCHAIQHAHQKGVIHRDIKPSNVLVALYDDRPVPKVIDFGIAKAAGQALTDRTLMTGYGAVVGTPEYMSPEQANLNNLDVDTRSDVYSLGVLLYELLTGTTPVDRKALGKAALLEILRIVREVEGAPPSAKLSTIDTLPNVAANRGTEPAKLLKLMRGELDCVVMKALEKDRTRRYETANGLAADVQRYLIGESVQAVPPSAGYRMRKFLHRNKGSAVAAGLVLVALLTGVVGTAFGLVEARRQEGIARTVAGDEKMARLSEEAERKRAEQAERLATDRLEQVTIERDKAHRAVTETKALNDFFVKDMLNAAQPHRFTGTGGGLTVEQVLDNASEKIDAAFRGQPEVEIRLRRTLAAVYANLGATRKELLHARRVMELSRARYGPDDETTIRATIALGLALADSGQRKEGSTLIRQEVDRAERLHGPRHPVTVFGCYTLALSLTDAKDYAAGETLYRKALEGSEGLGTGDGELMKLVALGGLGQNLEAQERYAEAEPLFRASIALAGNRFPEDHPEVLISRNGLGRCLSVLGQHKEAEALLRGVLQRYQKLLPSNHVAIYESMDDLAVALSRQRNFKEALPLQREALAALRAFGGLERFPVATMRVQGHLALLLRDQEKYAEAVPLLREVWDTYRRVLSETDRSTIQVLSILINCLIDSGQKEQAVPLAEKLVELLRGVNGPTSSELLGWEGQLGYLYLECNRPADAHKLLTHCLPVLGRQFGADDERTVGAKLNLAIAANRSGKNGESEALLRELMRLPAEHPGLNAATRLRVRSQLGKLMVDLQRYEEAAGYLSEWLDSSRKAPGSVEALRANLWNLAQARDGQGRLRDAENLLVELHTVELASRGPDYPRRSVTLGALGFNRLRQGKYVEAEAPLREVLTIREAKEPDVWSTFNTRSMLGGALLGQKKYAASEPLLVTGFEGMKYRETTIPPQGRERLPNAIDRLIELYVALDKPEEVKRWRAERAKYPDVAPAPREKK